MDLHELFVLPVTYGTSPYREMFLRRIMQLEDIVLLDAAQGVFGSSEGVPVVGEPPLGISVGKRAASVSSGRENCGLKDRENFLGRRPDSGCVAPPTERGFRRE